MRSKRMDLRYFKAGITALVLTVALLLPTSLQAQSPNAWINFGQAYYKIPVAQEGIYRLTYADLVAAGVPVGSVDPRRFNLYHRGVEQAIVVTGQNDAVFDPADVIEFYGKRNDGALDADLYEPPSDQPHAYYNLFSDTTAYFLTWNPMPVPGKRMETFFEVNNLGLTAEPAHQYRSLQLFTNEFAYVGDLQTTTFTKGECWTGTTICTVSSGCTGQQDFIIDNLLGQVPLAGNPSLEVMVNGRGEMFHNVEVYAGANAGALRLLGSLSFFMFETPTLSVPLNAGDIGADGKITVRVKIIAGADRDAVSVSYIRVTMPQDYNARGIDGKRFEVVPNAGGKSFVEIQNPVAGSTLYDITDVNNVRIIGTSAISGGFSAVVNNAVAGRTLLVNKTTRTASLKKVTFRSISPSAHDFIIITHRTLMKPALGYSNAVQAYAAYRASPAGGTYDTLVVEMDQLYNQFNYGETSPRAIFQFMKFLDAGGDPRFLFLIGKGLEVTLNDHRKTTHAPGDFRDLVPSAGVPGSDMAFTAGLAGTTKEPGVPTGRLTASDPVQVAAYLNKVKEAEVQPFDALWKKDLLHLSGGINAGEPQLFRQFVDGFKVIAEDIYLGGNVQTISKQTLNVELINVKDQVNKGLNLITFYGHSGPGTIDIDIGYVSDPTLGYQNAGKYPGFLINGCNAGRFFDNRVTFGEDWMLTPNKGAKAFIAHSSFGFVGALRRYTEEFYKIAFGDSTYLHKGIGEVQKETARRYLATYGSSMFSVTQIQQMVLLGDPAVSLFGASKPDFEVSPGSISVVSFDQTPVTAQSDSFAIEFRVRNFGRAQSDPLHVKVRRTFSDGAEITYDSTYSAVRYSETLRMIIRKSPDSPAGNTLFTVVIDPSNTVAELSESNNVSAASFFIPSNGSKNVFPPPYAIVPGSSTELSFQHSDIAAGPRDFIVEVDTAAAFGSPYLSRSTVTANGLGRRTFTLLPADSLAYYWRTRLANPLPGESSEWTSSTFTRVANSPQGWAQLKFDQLNDNDTSGLTWNRSTRRLEFLGTTSTVDVITYGSANPNAPSGVSLKINGDEFNIATQGQQCRNNTLNLLAFDKNSSAPYAGIPFSLFDPRTCGREPQMINSFTLAEMDQAVDGIGQFVANIKPSDSVVIFSIGDAGYSSWTTGIKFALEQLGVSSTQLSTLQPGEPFVILARKGSSPGTAAVVRTANSPVNAQSLTVNATITGRYSNGSVSTGLIGPAIQWGSLSSAATGVATSDSVSIEMFGVTLAGQETKLKTLTTGTHLLADIDPQSYPYLKLVFQTIDSIDLTPAQLRKWLVTYQPMAEGVLTYPGSKETQQVQEGEVWQERYGFVNISNQPFPDSLTVQVDAFTRIGRSLERKVFKIRGPMPGDTTWFAAKVDTRGKAGINDLTVFVNPRLLPEPYYDNNVLPLYARLEVQADKTGPLLDVTIDGRRIVNGDVVSRSPTIVASVIDRNPFLLKTDTTGFDLFVQYPCADKFNCPFRRITFSEPGLTWHPASATSDFSVEYHPTNLEVGSYLLRVSATDATGNPSGVLPYEVQFVVSDEPNFTVQAVYPNPSTERFNFRLFIGAEVPTDFQLEVFSSMGSLVQRVGNESLGLLHVGTNDLTVEARDVAGNLLPVGVYLFRFRAVVAGNTYTQTGRLVVAR
ncbi:MAG: hypothetical protein JNL40_07030 [Cyclobacteriaceae bacterium]|nr:hypothetical protein [Cyclobacteriaceae bacterium]